MTSLRTSLSLALLVGALLVGAVALGRDRGGEPRGPGSGLDPVLALGPSDGAGTTSTTGADGATTATGATTTVRPPATGLDPGLQAAFDRAQQAAADAGHALTVTSGHRTPERQQELLDEEVAERGSLEEALWWVFPPERSMHVQGLAVDVGDGPAADWLRANGSAYGLCHTLAWEWWHFEWRARWQESGSCPPEAQDPSEAPPI